MDDVAVIGAGIVGCAAAAYLAEGGARVTVYDREGIAAGASGRNSGVVQHPMHEDLAPLHFATLHEYRHMLALPAEPAGLLVLSGPGAPVEAFEHELRPEHLGDAHALDPALAEGLTALRLHTGWPIGPRTATEAFADRARAAGARFVVGEGEPGGVTLLATGAWTREVPVAPLWGVTVSVALERPPHLPVEEAGVETVAAGGEAEVFSLVTTPEGTVLGSSFAYGDQPDAAAVAQRLLARGARFVPALGGASAIAARACPRPQARDGLPYVGRLADGRYVCAGHGPWGISIGPATARLIADQILGRAEPPAALRPDR